MTTVTHEDDDEAERKGKEMDKDEKERVKEMALRAAVSLTSSARVRICGEKTQ